MPETSHSRKTEYERDGQVTVEGLLAVEELAAVCRRMTEIAEGRVSTFPVEQIEFEPGANSENRATTVRKINQCAQWDKLFMAHAANPKILDVVESLIGPDIKLYGSQCFMKPPGGIEKPYHQDSAYFTIAPPELVTCWAALDDRDD